MHGRPRNRVRIMSERLLALGFVVAIACGARAADLEKTFDLPIVHGAVPPQARVIRVQKGDAVRLRVTSDAPGELYVPGYGLATKVDPGNTSELAFRAQAAGRYPLEWRRTGDTGTSRSHSGTPLGYLEVRPK